MLVTGAEGGTASGMLSALVCAGAGRFVGGGDDTVQPWDSPAVKDVINCGPGTDKVYADKADVIKDNCERVRVQ